MDRQLIPLSRFLALVLRHRPEFVDIELDGAGWTDVEVLLAHSKRHQPRLDRKTLEEVVRTNDKSRFELSADGTRIRASQGHSVAVDLQLEAVEPPEVLFHGTVLRYLGSIKSQGLRPQKRHHVHLSPDRETATRVGSRRGRAVVLEIAAGAMARAGHEFYCSTNGVWLTAEVPPGFLRLSESG